MPMIIVCQIKLLLSKIISGHDVRGDGREWVRVGEEQKVGELDSEENWKKVVDT